jgi:cytochrome c-type biogenesis protein CcmH/NrfG
MDSNEQYSISPKSGRLRKRVRVKYKKKKPVVTKNRLKKLWSNPLLILLVIAFLTLTTYYFMPKYGVYSTKYRQANDNETHNANKRIKETDVYE